MAKRRHSKNEELMLIPFLDILCSLIGVLVLIIVVLCVAQTQRAQGRTPEELERSQQYVEAKKKQEELLEKQPELKALMEKKEKLQAEATQKIEREAKLRKLVASTAEMKQARLEISQNLMKELDDLLLELEGITKQEIASNKEINVLMEEIKKRQLPEDKKTPPVIVQPGGSGLAAGTKVFFVETSGGKITLYWDGTEKTVLSATDEVVATDPLFQHYLKTIHAMPNAKIIFLLRDDGMNAFNKAAGWAQVTYGYRVDQIGRLPIPGRGVIDLQMFKDFLGKLPIPAAETLPPPAAPPTPPAT